MQSFEVVEVLDVVPDRRLRFVPASVTRIVNELGAQRSEEALGDSIVPAIAFAAHARRHPKVGERFAVVLARVWASSIGVMHESGRNDATHTHCVRECAEGKRSVVGFAERPTDDAA